MASTPRKFTVSGRVIRTSKGREAKLPFPVLESMEFEGMLVLVLDVPTRKDYPQNVFALDEEARTLWQGPAVPSPVKRGCFVGVARAGEWVRVFHFDGMAYDLDPADGHVVRHEFLK